MLTTTMLGMKDVLRALEQADLRKKVKVMVGGAPVTQAFADEVGADAYGESAATAVDKAKELLGIAVRAYGPFDGSAVRWFRLFREPPHRRTAEPPTLHSWAEEAMTHRERVLTALRRQTA
ncbi:MAG: hypothetical protein M0C28_22975 [Candidatus Moduliflexus flocculans]|nr:hypothetical protein [Candidatus Moduliflexus flocculans]